LKRSLETRDNSSASRAAA